ncbi:hypothetical protein CONCODRAFT_4395 [Conidiobolus coronatus NRRL 28638]|uniref:Uncharacterized protein n=1 Tax=Conidiobolus coronatus (strain ATCC 28846 / CBS 209.66 / NRRL 28638) TaxID=796925 RepID=A0A137PCR4_CONC2|nr:hypothetical protein CONCODRAFT_4395 [Conidiobolus coronatus NRRL 28638]|eukprot:KXN72787.1 hypothetical protein CONCODRAFT_4395 [Conidiobolus coronatus NRRL 28638]
MKNFVLFFASLTYLQAWTIDLKIENKNNPNFFSREFYITVKSNSDGEAKNYCFSHNNKNYNCERAYKEVSNDEKFSISNLKCKESACKAIIELDSTEFNVEITCLRELNFNLNAIYNKNKNESCEVKRTLEI